MAMLMDTVDGDARALLSAAEQGWSNPIRQCPGWTAADLVRHQGGLFYWMAALAGAGGARAPRHVGGTLPEDFLELRDWYLAGLDQVVPTLGRTDSEQSAWTFSSQGDQTVG